MKANDRQLEAIRCNASRVVTIAGAGAGKTFVLINAVRHKLEQGVPEQNILLITFTRKAAFEMKERIENDNIFASTIHSWCLYWLRQKIGYFTIWDRRDYMTAMRNIAKEYGSFTTRQLNGMVSNIQFNISNMTTQNITSLELAMYRDYISLMRKCKALDFTSMIERMYYFLIKDEEFRREIMDTHTHIFVDEYQDVSRLQHEIIKLVANEFLFIVGDERQSIYGFRAGSPEYLEEWKRDESSNVIVLNVNYRNTYQINNRAEMLFGDKRVDKCRAHGSDIVIKYCDSKQLEAINVCRLLSIMTEEELNNTAVLYRMHKEATRLIEELNKWRIPYKLHSRVDIFDTAVARDIIAYLKVSSNPADDIAFFRIMNKPKRGIGKKKAADIVTNSADKSLFEYAIEKYYNNYEEFCDVMCRISECENILDKMYIIVDYLGIDYNLISVQMLYNIASDFTDTQEFLDYITAIDESDNGSGVHLMTVHAAKGLEFDNVIIIACDEDVLPMLDADIDEERRIFYVALTRAKENVVILYTNHASRFINEIGFGKKQVYEPRSGFDVNKLLKLLKVRV